LFSTSEPEPVPSRKAAIESAPSPQIVLFFITKPV
jgi:hypothetical protein